MFCFILFLQLLVPKLNNSNWTLFKALFFQFIIPIVYPSSYSHLPNSSTSLFTSGFFIHQINYFDKSVINTFTENPRQHPPLSYQKDNEHRLCHETSRQQVILISLRLRKNSWEDIQMSSRYRSDVEFNMLDAMQMFSYSNLDS